MPFYLYALNFKKGDLVYLINNDKIQKDKIYKVENISILTDGNWHDGFGDAYYAELKDMDTQEIKKKEVAYVNHMNSYCLIRAKNVEKCN